MHSDFIESLELERSFKKDFQELVDKYGATVRVGYGGRYEVEILPVYEGRKKVRDGCYFDLDTNYAPSK